MDTAVHNTMSLYKYLKPSSGLLEDRGVSSSVIAVINKEVTKVQDQK